MEEMELECTPVFDWNWEAINLKMWIVRRDKGSVFRFFKQENDESLTYWGKYNVNLKSYRLDEFPEITYLVDINSLEEFPLEIQYRRYKYIVNEGSSRSSKTYSLIDCFDLYARANELKRMTVWRDTKVDCKKTVLDDMLKRLKATNRFELDSKFNATESLFRYENGSTIEVQGADEANKVHGLSQDVAWLNEPYKISETIFNQIDQRTSDFIFIDWNPKLSWWVDEVKKKRNAILIKSTFKDNPFCPIGQRKKMLSYQPVARCRIVEERLLTEQEAREYNAIKNLNKFAATDIAELIRCQNNEAESTARDFEWSVYGLGEKAERPNRIFRWKEISIHDYNKLELNTYNGCDWGKVDPWGIVEVKYLDGCLYVHQLNYQSENELKEVLSPAQRANILANDEGMVSYRFRQLGIPEDRSIICDSNRPLKVVALREAGWDYAVAPAKPKGSILDGIDLLTQLNVFFTSTSINIKYEQENYSWEVDRFGTVLEVPEDINNHLMDAIRYVALWLQAEEIINIV